MLLHYLSSPLILLGGVTMAGAIVVTVIGWKRATTGVQRRYWVACCAALIGLGIWEICNGVSISVPEGTTLDTILKLVMAIAAGVMLVALIMGLRYTGLIRQHAKRIGTSCEGPRSERKDDRQRDCEGTPWRSQ